MEAGLIQLEYIDMNKFNYYKLSKMERMKRDIFSSTVMLLFRWILFLLGNDLFLHRIAPTLFIIYAGVDLFIKAPLYRNLKNEQK